MNENFLHHMLLSVQVMEQVQLYIYFFKKIQKIKKNIGKRKKEKRKVFMQVSFKGETIERDR